MVQKNGEANGILIYTWFNIIVSVYYIISSKVWDKLVYLEIYFCGHLALMYSGCVSNVFSIWLSALNFIHVLYSWLFLITKFHRMCYPTLRYHSLVMYDTYSSCSLLPNGSCAVFCRVHFYIAVEWCFSQFSAFSQLKGYWRPASKAIIMTTVAIGMVFFFQNHFGGLCAQINREEFKHFDTEMSQNNMAKMHCESVLWAPQCVTIILGDNLI